MFSLLAHVARRLRSTFRKAATQTATTRRRRDRYKNKSWMAAEVLEDRTLLDGVVGGGGVVQAQPQFVFDSWHLSNSPSPVNSVSSGEINDRPGTDLVWGTGENPAALGQLSFLYLDNWSRQTIESTGIGPVLDVAVSDIDGDSDLDIVTASKFHSDGTDSVKLTWWRNTGGGFNSLVRNDIATIPGPTDMRLAVGNLDGDSHPDIVTLRSGDSGSPSILTIYSNADGGEAGAFVESRSYVLDKELVGDVVLTDLDGDDDLDIAASVNGQGDVGEKVHKLYVLENFSESGNGISLPNPVDTPFSGWIDSLASGDVNEDGVSDLFVGSHTDDDASVHWFDTTAQENPFHHIATYTATNAAVGGLAAGDLNNDGHVDLVTAFTASSWDGSAYTQIHVYEQDASNPGTFRLPVTAGSTDSRVTSVALSNINGDQWSDILVGEALNNGTGRVYGFMVSVNTPPTLEVNDQADVERGGLVAIDNTMLRASDVQQEAWAVYYTVGAMPAHGRLLLASGYVWELSEGAQFSQYDIDSGRLVYVHDGGDSTEDSFTFSLNDGHASAGVSTFHLNVTEPAPQAEIPIELVSRVHPLLPHATPNYGVNDWSAGERPISADGNLVVYHSESPNIVPGDANARSDVFLYNRSAGTTTRISNGLDGESNGYSYSASISANGEYVVFVSDASNLVAGDDNESTDIFLYRVSDGLITRVSVASDGAQADNSSWAPSISDDGNVIAFVSMATNLNARDNPGSYSNVYVVDRAAGTIHRVSRGLAEGPDAPINWSADRTTVSGDGQVVAFESAASNIVAGDTAGSGWGPSHSDVFIYERAAGTIERVSLAADGAQGLGSSHGASLSADGRYVSFTSYATNLVSGDDNGCSDIFVVDRQLNTIERVSIGDDEAQSNDYSYNSRISADGRYVAFETSATNLVSGPSYWYSDVFLRDRVLGTTELLSVATHGTPGNNTSTFGGLRADGGAVAIFSYATNFAAGDYNDSIDFFVHDRAVGEQAASTELISRTAANLGPSTGNGDSYQWRNSVSGDGRYTVFTSYAEDLVPGDTNESYDVFLYDHEFGTIERVSILGYGTLNPAEADSHSFDGVLNAGVRNPDGTYSGSGQNIAFVSYFGFVPGDENYDSDIYLLNRATGEITRVSAGLGGEDANGWSEGPSISADGSAIVFASGASNLVEGDDNGESDIFLFDVLNGTITRVSQRADGGGSEAYSHSAVVSADGNWVTFVSSATNLTDDVDDNWAEDVYLWERSTGTITRVSAGLGGSVANSYSERSVLSGDGSYVAFSSTATNLVEGDDNEQADIFVWTRSTGQIERVSVSSDGGESNLSSYAPTISDDGTIVAFQSDAFNLTSGDTNFASDIFVHNRSTGETIRVTRIERNHDDDYYYSSSYYDSRNPVLSADGRTVVFDSDSDRFVSRDYNFETDVFRASLAESTGGGGQDTNQAPQTASTPIIIGQDQPVQFSLRDFASDIETEDAELSFVVTLSTNGSVSVVLDEQGAWDGHTVRFTPDPEYVGPASVSFQVTDTGNGNAPPITVDGTVNISVRTPVAADDSATTLEDSSGVTFDVAANDTIYSGPGTWEAITFPSENEGDLQNNGNGSFTFVPKVNFGGTVSFIYRMTDSAGHEKDATVTITVTPVADAPTVAVNDVAGDEDTSIGVDVSAALSDADGSENLAVTVSGIPAGATLFDDLGNSFEASAGNTSADVSAWDLVTLSITPPAHSDGDFELTVTAVATESGNGDSSTITRTINVVVNAVADAPTLDVQDASGQEDSAIPVTVDPALVDADGSETLSLSVTGVPSGAVISDGGNSVTSDSATTPIDLTGWSLINLRVTPPAESDVDFTLTFVATATEQDGGNAASTTRTVNVAVSAVADPPAIQVNPAGLEGDEDTPIGISEVATELLDGDGSETLAVTVNGIPVGAVLASGGNSFTATEGNTSVDITDWSLSNLTITPPLHSGDDFVLAFRATATEAAGGEAFSEINVGVVVHAVADAPTLSVTNAVGSEDTPISLTIDPALVDVDGSESLSLYVSLIPVGAVLSDGANSFTASAGSTTANITGWTLSSLTITPPLHSDADFDLLVTAKATEGENGSLAQTQRTIEVTVNAVADAPSLTVAASRGDEDTAISLSILPALVDADGSESLTLSIAGVPVGATLTDGTNSFTGSADCNTVDITGWSLGSLEITPPLHSDGDFTLTVTATATEAIGNDAASTTRSLAVTVDAIADAPTLTVTNTRTDEDTTISLSIVQSLVDDDGSETLSLVVSAIPIGAVLSDGTNSFTAGAGGTSVDISGWNLGGLAITPPLHSDVDFTLTVTATATEEIGGSQASTTQLLTVVVDSVADAPNLSVADTTGNEDTAIPLTVSTSLVDADGSETLALVVSNIPVGATLAKGGNSFTATAGNTSVDITSWGLSNLAGLSITAPLNSDEDFTLGFTATSTEADTENAGQTTQWLAVTVGSSDVTVVAVADAPNLSVAAASGREDTVIPLSVATSLVDADGSETLALRIAGIPAGFTLSDGVHTFVGDGTTTADVTEWIPNLANLTIVPPLNNSEDFTLTLTATATEGANGSAASTVRTLHVTVLPVNDAPFVESAGPEMSDEFASVIQIFDVVNHEHRLLASSSANVTPSFTIDQGRALSFDLHALVSDVETDPSDFTFAVSVSADQGQVRLRDGHIAVFIPNPDFVGTATFTFTATDTGDEFVGGAGELSDREPITRTGTVSIIVTRFQDMGDAPDSYGTVAGSDGARHLGTHLPETESHRIIRLGRVVGAGEQDGQPGELADGDDASNTHPNQFSMQAGEVDGVLVDDDEGVFFVMGLGTRSDLDDETHEGITVKSRIGVVAPSGGYLDAWIDFNGDGIFQDCDVEGEYSEHLFGGQSQLLTATQEAKYINYFDIFVPPSSFVGTTYARFRVSSEGNLAPTGFALDGEVEDYKVTIADMTPGPDNTTPETFSDSMDVASQEFIESFANELIADPDFVPPPKGDPNYVPFAFFAKGGAGGREAEEGEEGFEAIGEQDAMGETLEQIIDRINDELQASRPAGENWLVFVVHPIDFVVTDSSGRQFGSVGGSVTQNDFGNKVTYSGDGAVEVLVIRGASHGEYKMDFVGVGGVFRGGSSLLTGYGEQVVTFQGALGAGGTIDLALDYAPPPDLFTQFGLGNQIVSNGQGQGQAFLNVDDNVEGEEDLDALAKLAGLDAENLSSQDTLRQEWDRMVKAVRTNTTAAKRLMLDELTPDWLATWPEAFDELTANGESAELVEEFWKGLGQSLMGGIPGQVFHLAEIMGVEIPHLFLPNDAPPADALPAKAGEAGAAAGDAAEGKTSQSAAARRNAVAADVLHLAGPLAVALNDGRDSGTTGAGQTGANAAVEGNRSRTFPAPVTPARRNPAAPLETSRSNAP